MPNFIDVHVGNRIRLLREKQAISVERMAMKIGVDVQHIERYELGALRVDVSILFKIAAFLEVPVKELYTGLLNVNNQSGIEEQTDSGGKAAMVRNYLRVVS
jgi:transcriptional regulator with XRE-family HTH domain